MRISVEQRTAPEVKSEPTPKIDFEGELLSLEQAPPQEEEDLTLIEESSNQEDPNKLLWLSLQESCIQQATIEETANTTEIRRSAPITKEGFDPQIAVKSEPAQENPSSAVPIEEPRELPADEQATRAEPTKSESKRERPALIDEVSIPAPKPEPIADAEVQNVQRFIPIELEIEKPKRSSPDIEVAPQATQRLEADADPITRLSEEMQAAPLLQPERAQTNQRVQLVIGEGDQQVKLSVFANEHQVKVTTQSAPPELMRAMHASVSELQSSLQQHGLNLSHFGSGSQEQSPRQQERAPEEEPPRRVEAQIKKRARAIL
jgi:hypothetical protein